MAARTDRAVKKQRQELLDALRSGASVTAACRVVGVPRRTAYQWREDDENFAAEWADALEEGTDALEDEARRRAMESSDTLMIFLLKGRRPEVYKDRVANEHTGKDGAPIEHVHKIERTIVRPKHSDG